MNASRAKPQDRIRHRLTHPNLSSSTDRGGTAPARLSCIASLWLNADVGWGISVLADERRHLSTHFARRETGRALAGIPHTTFRPVEAGITAIAIVLIFIRGWSMLKVLGTCALLGVAAASAGLPVG